MSMSVDKSDGDDLEDKYSETENVAGVALEKARPIGLLGSVITIPLTLYFAVFGLLELSYGLIILAWFPAIGAGLSIMYALSEKRWMGSWIMNTSAGVDGTKKKQQSKNDKKSVCRECHEEISSDVKRCPNCGWKPKKRGGLWWGTTAIMGFNPIGWALGAKGASDNYKASKGVTKEIQAKDEKVTEDNPNTSSESDPTDTLERLNELKEQGVITESEFGEKKEELLEQI